MHHTLRLYSRYREGILRWYMFGAKCTRIPLLGRLARGIANAYGKNVEGAYLITTAEAQAIVDSAAGVAVGPCTCRSVFHNCDHPVNVEILLGPTRHIFTEHMPEESREITGEEARRILADSHERGLIHTVIRCRDNFYAICNCCTCCCVPLRLSKHYGIGKALVRHPDIVGEFRKQQETPAPA